MIPYLTLGVTLLSLAATLFLLWVLAAAPKEEEPTIAIGLRIPVQEEEDPEDGC